MTIIFEQTYRMVIPSLYNEPDDVYLPLTEFLDFVKVPNEVSSEGKIIKGYFETKANSFEVNFVDKFATFKANRISIEKEDAIMDVGFLYLKTTVFKKLFGFDMTFNKRALAFQFSSPFELPLFKLMKQEKLRDNLRISGSEDAVYDTVMKRDYHWYRGHMLDWSIASTQSNNSPVETRFELGSGAEVLGGETNIWLNYSTQYGLKRNQQRYYWRWADNFAKVVRQVQVGRLTNSSIASVLAPVDGVTVTNALTTIRKALGDYLIADHTEPEWIVELYLNNQLISYTRADASGYYSFKVPIVYGTSNVTLRFYGPNGEIRSEQKTFNMPYNMLPKGEFEYRLTGGTLLDTTNARFAKAEFNYGLNRKLTLGTGVEYLSTLTKTPEIPFINFTFQPFARLLMTGEYAHRVRTKVAFNFSTPSSVVLDGAYSWFVPGQEAIIYNYLQERSMGLSMPLKLRNLSNTFRATIRQNVYEKFTYSSGEIMWSANYQNISMVYSNYANMSVSNSLNLYGNLTLGTRLPGDMSVRASVQYNYSYNGLISLRMEMERKLFANGFGSLKLEHNFLAGGPSLNLSFRYDFPYMMTNAAASISKGQVQLTEGASGSFAFNSGGKYIYTDRRNAVGRSGVSIMPFVDVNFNGIKDKNEPISKGLRARINGGQVLHHEIDSIIRIVGLEPFVDYNLRLDESGFDNVSLRLAKKNVKVITDPNQFKMIMLPVLPMAEIFGTVADESGKGIGRIIVRVMDKQGNLVSKVLTESDGYFNYIGYKPGDYKIFVDSTQLTILKYEANPVYATVLENLDGDVVDAGTIELVRKRASQVRKVRKALPGGGFEEVEEKDTIVTVVQEPIEEDTLNLFTILFNVDKTVVKPLYFEPLRQLARYLNKPVHEELGIDIQGHTDSDASETYNLFLSNRRAQAVKDLLVKNGVRSDRLKTSAFGKSKLLNSNKTFKDKSLNRRVIFKPIKVYEKAERSLEEVLDSMQRKKGVIPSGKNNRKVAPSKSTHWIGAPTTSPISEPPVQNQLDGRTLSVGATPEGTEVELQKGLPEWCMLFKKGNRYWFQAGAFKTLRNAQKLAEQLSKNTSKQVLIIEQDGWAKVQIGYYTNMEAALDDAKLLRMKGFISR